jgi:hypothetical protein
LKITFFSRKAFLEVQVLETIRDDEMSAGRPHEEEDSLNRRHRRDLILEAAQSNGNAHSC